eukprot:1640446-Pyramimonas_sp.AAC.1
MILTLGAASSSDMRGNLLIDSDPEDQQWPPQQLDFRAPVRLPHKDLCHVAALHQVGRTGQDGCLRWKEGQGMLSPYAASSAQRSDCRVRQHQGEETPGLRYQYPQGTPRAPRGSVGATASAASAAAPAAPMAAPRSAGQPAQSSAGQPAPASEVPPECEELWGRMRTSNRMKINPACLPRNDDGSDRSDRCVVVQYDIMGTAVHRGQ